MIMFFIKLLLLSLFYSPHLLVNAQYINVDDHQNHLHVSTWNTFYAGLFVALLILVFYIVYRYFDRYLQRWSAHDPAHDPTHQAQHGLDPSTLGSFPVYLYPDVSGLALDKAAPLLECAVCLSPFEKDEKVRKLPTCQHVFHLECVNRWLAGHTTCPLCRAELAPRLDNSRQTAPDCVDVSRSGSRTEAVRDTVDDIV